MAMLTKTFRFTDGPRSTPMTADEVAEVVQQVGDGRQYLGRLQRSSRAAPRGRFGAFTPTDEDLHFALEGTANVDRRIGWCRLYREPTAHGGARELGWRVVFDVYDVGFGRHVVATVHGTSDRHEVRRFVRLVFDRFVWESPGPRVE